MILTTLLPALYYCKNYIVSTNQNIRHSTEFFTAEAESIIDTFSIGEFSGYIMDYPSFPVHLYSFDFVETIEEDNKVQIYRNQRPLNFFEEYGFFRQMNPVWGLDRIDQRSEILNKQYFYETTSGKNVNVFVVDTGIELAHPEFEGRAIFGINTVDKVDTDCNSHGTHVAGTIGSKTFGVAKQCSLYAVKVLDCQGSGSFSGILKGIEYVLNTHRKNTKSSVVNMSLGGPKSDSINRAVSELVKNGVHVVVAAGNENQDACNVSPSSASTNTDIISIGATNDKSEMASFSNFGKCVSILAPGEAIMSTVPGKKTSLMSGTSMASPHAAGVVALYLGEKGKTSTSDMKKKMLEMSTKNSIKNIKKDTNNSLLFSLF